MNPEDPPTYAAALGLMAMVAMVACWHPAGRVIRLDPAQILREEWENAQ